MGMLSRRPSKKQRVSSQTSIEAPTGGLNARDPLADMPETDAVQMDNYFPTQSSVNARNGSLTHATGMTGNVETVMVYNSGASQFMFGVSSGSIYDATSPGAVGAAEVTGLSNSRLQYINFGTAGGHFLLAVNGQNKMQVFDGTNWYVDGTTTSVTGFDTALAATVTNFKNRVWFIQRETMLAWYLPTSSIGGAAQPIDLSGLFKLGGFLMAMANWTIDNASGIDDYAAFITSEGEVALYKGTDPTSASTWALVGTFRMGKPIGRRCFCKAGADVLVLTTDGAFPLSKALLTDRTQNNLAATDKIVNLINTDTNLYFNNFGWQPIIYPNGTKLIVNVPEVEGVQSKQYVMNTQTGSWCRFLGWNAFSWEVFGQNIFYGASGSIIQADTGASDDGNSIDGVVQQAFSYFGKKGIQKLFKMARPIFISEGSVVPSIAINVDFNLNDIQLGSTTQTLSGASWDTASWDTSDWAFGDVVSKDWQSLTGVGIAGGLRIETSLNNIGTRWASTDVVYEAGGSL